MEKGAENEEISIDIETGDEIEMEEGEVANASLKGKMKALRNELKDAQKERDENLAGWQRAKADLVNFRKSVEADRERNEARAKGSLIRGILPALDTFASATRDASWQSVDKSWREGVERIQGQLHKALEAEGLTTFGAVGEVFDPTKHECISTVSTDNVEEDDTIAEVLQQGYGINNELVRPAKVVVAQVKE